MKLRLSLGFAALTTAVISGITPFISAQTATFGEEAVEQERFVAVASPLGEDRYDLLVIEQVPGERECWREYGSNPVQVEPLLLEFDFTGICRRATDSNGYSIRVDGRDLGLDYLLRVVEQDGEVQLVGTPRDFSSDNSEIVIGRTYGIEDGFMKIQLKPGWDFTKRTYDGKTLGHVYFSGTQAAIDAPLDFTPETAVAFPDVRGDLYSTEIGEAVALGFISGFPDNTFRPEAPLTREQLVSMVIEALETIEGVSANPPTDISASPYPDVPPSRWSAAKIEWARQNQIVTGYPDGTFRPQQEVTRAEMLAVLRRAAQYAKAQQGLSPELAAQQTANNFTDISGHWAQDLISQMSAYCGVASPLNETGSDFNPDTTAQRNYAAAATLRTLNCVNPSADVVRDESSPEMMEESSPEMMEESSPEMMDESNPEMMDESSPEMMEENN